MTKVHFRLPSVANKRPAILNKLIGTLQPFLSKCGMQNIFQGKTGLSILPSPLPPINVERAQRAPLPLLMIRPRLGPTLTGGRGGGGRMRWQTERMTRVVVSQIICLGLWVCS